ncbi:MAG: DNA alkylation repair protein [Muribaculaceae bacterium]|nr:DNA alkylation repair protein [Muribaculaceae bacterium]
MPTYSPMQTVKRHFFAMRNGVIADTLRKAGSPFRVIFGLNLPQIVEIARLTGPSQELAEALWANSGTRESMLMAPMIAERESFTKADALRWIDTIPTAEVADILCQRLLRSMPYAWELAEELAADSEKHMNQYTGMRLAFNLVSTDPAHALELTQRYPDAPLAAALAEEAKFLTGEQ